MPHHRRSHPPPPASMNDDENLLTEILLRLPGKTLIRFKSVCKKWLSLISSDYFCHKHTLRKPKLQQSLIIQMHTLQLFYFNQTTDGENVMIPYTLSVPPNHQIVQGCNGLLLLEYDRLKNCHYVYNPTTRELKRHHKHSYYVYNPTTRQSREITLPHSDTFAYVEAINLAFDPSQSPYYKVVCVRSPSDTKSPSATYQIEVYDSESQTWKLSLEPFTHPRIHEGVHWNNSIYWKNVHGGYFILDLATDETKHLSYPPLPYKGDDYNVFEYLQESDGHLYHFMLTDKYRVSIALWEMGGDDDSEWLYKDLQALHEHNDIDTSPIGFVGAGDACSLVTCEPGMMMAYNLHSKSYEVLVDLTCQPNFMLFDVMTGFRFGEILALV